MSHQEWIYEYNNNVIRVVNGMIIEGKKVSALYINDNLCAKEERTHIVDEFSTNLSSGELIQAEIRSNFGRIDCKLRVNRLIQEPIFKNTVIEKDDKEIEYEY